MYLRQRVLRLQGEVDAGFVEAVAMVTGPVAQARGPVLHHERSPGQVLPEETPSRPAGRHVVGESEG